MRRSNAVLALLAGLGCGVREGYGTVVRRLNTLFESPSLDVSLVTLSDVHCAGASCL